MIVWICTDMEGLAGVDHWDQCYHPDDSSLEYTYGRQQLTADLNAAAMGCFDAGADEVRVLDGHGRNGNRGFIPQALDPRVKRVWFTSATPVRWEGLDQTVTVVAMVGQHSMAGTLNGFIDHTQSPRQIVRFLINGEEYGEMGQFALYAGACGVPLAYVSGDEALCAEAARQFPGAVSTPTKRGTSWSTCELYPMEDVRERIRRDIACAVAGADGVRPWQVEPPVEITVEWAWSGAADGLAAVPGVRRLDARTVSWTITDPRDVYTWPSDLWRPPCV